MIFAMSHNMYIIVIIDHAQKWKTKAENKFQISKLLKHFVFNLTVYITLSLSMRKPIKIFVMISNETLMLCQNNNHNFYQ